MDSLHNLRIAFVYPSVELGAYWQPVLRELTQLIRETIFYTGKVWPGFEPQAPGGSAIKIVGETRFVEVTLKAGAGYGRGFFWVSPKIVGHLLKTKPDVVFASAFSLWTVFALLLKPIGRWRLIVMWEGSSPTVDFRDSKFRLLFRHIVTQFAEALITNNHAGKNYLVQCIGVEEKKIFVKPYMIPDLKALTQSATDCKSEISQPLQCPVFLSVGRIEQRKGIHLLLQACSILHRQGCTNFKLQIVGRGPQREELEVFIQEENLAGCVEWIGWIDYGSLGKIFNAADVFIFPTLEDTWGMVVLEAMAFGKPVLCSEWAGAAEMVVDGENGYIIDPHHPAQVAENDGLLYQ